MNKKQPHDALFLNMKKIDLNDSNNACAILEEIYNGYSEIIVNESLDTIYREVAYIQGMLYDNCIFFLRDFVRKMPKQRCTNEQIRQKPNYNVFYRQ